MLGPCFCVKPLQSSSGRLGKEGKRTRGPFSATRTSWKLKLDGFSSSRGALQDPHHEKAPSSKKTGGRWAAARRRAAAALGGGAPPPNGPRGRRPLGGWRAPRARAHRDHQTTPTNPKATAARTRCTNHKRNHYLSGNRPFRAPIYRRRPYCVTVFCPSLQNFRSFAFLAGFALFPKSRKVTKIDHTAKLQIF